MRRLSCHWLLSLLMALVLAIAPPVAAGGHHGDAACLESLDGQDLSAAGDVSETADPSEPHASVSSPCCMPCVQCGATMALLSGGAAVSAIPLTGAGVGTPSGPPDPFERPPRA
jgi:hypothetical protein